MFLFLKYLRVLCCAVNSLKIKEIQLNNFMFMSYYQYHCQDFISCTPSSSKKDKKKQKTTAELLS
jgi:hypothetical protein